MVGVVESGSFLVAGQTLLQPVFHKKPNLERNLSYRLDSLSAEDVIACPLPLAFFICLL